MNKVELGNIKEAAEYEIIDDQSNIKHSVRDVLDLVSEVELWHGIAKNLYEKEICDVCDEDECWDDCECSCHNDKYESRERAKDRLIMWEEKE